MTVITVTAQNIAAGVPEDCENCPIALAILEAFPGVGYVAVGPGTCTIAPADGPTGATDVEPPQQATCNCGFVIPGPGPAVTP